MRKYPKHKKYRGTTKRFNGNRCYNHPEPFPIQKYVLSTGRLAMGSHSCAMLSEISLRYIESNCTGSRKVQIIRLFPICR